MTSRGEGRRGDVHDRHTNTLIHTSLPLHSFISLILLPSSLALLPYLAHLILLFPSTFPNYFFFIPFPSFSYDSTSSILYCSYFLVLFLRLVFLPLFHSTFASMLRLLLLFFLFFLLLFGFRHGERLKVRDPPE